MQTLENRPSSTGTALLLLAAATLLGCAVEPIVREGTHALAELEGRLIHGESLLVVPNRAWRVDEENDTWLVGHSAALICQVHTRPETGLTVVLTPDEGDPEGTTPSLELAWNGEDVSERLHRRDSGILEVEIPAEWLEPGLHFLDLRRLGAGEDFGTFREVGYRHGGHERAFDTEGFYTYRYLSNLLNFGVTGSWDRESLGGFVMLGPRTVEIDLGTEEGGLFQTKVQNSGAGPAIFRVRVDFEEHEYRLEPHLRRHVRLEIPPGSRYVELSAGGDPASFFLWGAPHFFPRGTPAATPIVLITLDTTRRDVFYAYRGDAAVTPHLNAFAAQATVYRRAYTTAPWTLPSHASIFTGLYPAKHGAGVSADHLEVGFDTLAEKLRRRGYLTAGFAGGVLSSAEFGIGQGFDFYRDVEGFENKADDLTDAALELLSRAVVGEGGPAGGDRPPIPFFLFINYFDPHFPFLAPEPFQQARGLPELRRALPEGGMWREILDGSADAWESAVEGEAPADPAGLAALRAAYDAEVAFTDAELGRVLRKLQDWGLYRDALIIVTSDHGELLGERGHFSHSTRLESELVEVPLFIKWPGQREGRRDDTLVSLVDLFPTILAAAGVDPGTGSDGLRLAPQGDPGAFAARRYVLAEEHATDFHHLSPRMWIADDLIALLGHDRRREVWVGGSNCYQQRDGNWRRASCKSSDSSEARRIFAELELAAFRPRVDRIGMTAGERERLRALGYIR